MNYYSYSEENYLKTIFHLEQNGSGSVSTNDIAEKMDTKASSVSDMLQKLSKKGLLNYIKYQGVTLTDTGREHALRVIRKHRLWEVFLVDKLDFKWDEVHDLAEQLEHIQSVELTNRLDKFLDYPSFDPHGDPIPDINLEFKKVHKILLSELEVGQKGMLVGLVNSDNDFLQYLDKLEFKVGVNMKVLNIEPFDSSMQVICNGKTHSISHTVASNIYIKTA